MERKEQVLEAARQLFFRSGYRGTTMEQIARQAGYSKRTVYLDYQNKDELFITVCAEGGELILERLRQIPAAGLPVEECVERFIEVFLAFSREHAETFRMIFSEATPAIVANCSEPVRQRAADLERDCVGVVVSWAERATREGLIPAVDPWEAAGILTGVATGIILLSMGGSQTVFSRRTREEMVRQAVRVFWRGLRAMEAELSEGGPT